MSFLGVDLDEDQEAELEEIINSRVLEEETTTPEAMPEDTTEDAPEEMEPVEALSPDETKDLALWYTKAKQWHTQGKGSAVDWECKHLREVIAAPIRLRLADAKTELDIVKAFEVKNYFGTMAAMKPSMEQGADSIKALADSINRMVEPQRKEEGMNIIIDTQGNAIKAQNNDTAAILEAIKALVTQNSTKADIIIPAPIVNVPITVQPAAAPVNNVTVQPAAPANITVQPADVVLPAMPMKATITTDKTTGKKTLEVQE
jgi:hypothetical protein